MVTFRHDFQHKNYQGFGIYTYYQSVMTCHAKYAGRMECQGPSNKNVDSIKDIRYVIGE